MDKKELIVRKSNDMILNFAIDLETAMEMDLFDYMIANIKSPMYDEEFHLLEFDVRDFYKASYGKLPGGVDYSAFKATVERLAQRRKWGIVTEGKYKNYETIMRLIEKPYINPDTGKVVLKLDDNLKPYLLNFANKPHTRFLYLTKAALSTGYTKRLYEILKSKEGMAYGIWPPGTDYLPIEEFKEMMYVPKSYKAGNIKKRILNPAKEEIEEKTDIKFSYREIKEGKAVVGYQFRIAKQEDKIDKAPPPPRKKKEKKSYTNQPDEVEINEYPAYITTLLETVGKNEDAEVLIATVEEYLVLLCGEPTESQKESYVASLTSKVNRAKKINSTKLAYAEGIVRKELEKLKTDKVSGGAKKAPVRTEIVPEWLKKSKEEQQQEQDTYKDMELLENAYKHYKKYNNEEKMRETADKYYELTGKDLAKELEEIEELKAKLGV